MNHPLPSPAQHCAAFLPRSSLPHLVLILLAASVLFFHGLSRRDLWSSHEARAGQDAQSLLLAGDWLLPKLADGRLEMQKPPFYYWCTAAIALVRSRPVDALAVRLPAALSALGGMLVLYWFLRLRGRPTAGLVAALLLGTMVHYTWLGRVGRIDMPLAFTVSVSLCGFQYVLLGGGGCRWACLIGAYVSLAVSLLLKGPIGIVLTAVVLSGWIAVESSLAGQGSVPALLPSLWRSVWKLGLPWGLPLVLALAGPWYWLANRSTGGEFFEFFLIRHNLERGLGNEFTGHNQSPFFYLARIAVDLLPWSLFLPPSLAWLACRGRWRQDAESRFGLVWLGTITIFLTCMSFKRSDYLLPAYPGAALVLGCAGERWLAGRSGRRLFAGAVAVCGLGWVWYVDLHLPALEPARELRSFALEVRRRVPAPAPILVFRAESHAFQFHAGRPVVRIMEWENLDIWASRPERVFVVMPADSLAECGRCLEAGVLYPLVSTDDLAGSPHEEGLVLVSNQPDPAEDSLPPVMAAAAGSKNR